MLYVFFISHEGARAEPALQPKPTAKLLLLLAPLQEQRRLRPKRPRLDLCAALSLNANENAVIRIVGSPERINLDTVLSHDVIVTAYNVQSRTYNIAYDEDHTPSYFGGTTS